MTQPSSNLDVDIKTLRDAVSEEYKVVAESPQQGFHFHTGRPLARILDCSEGWLANISESSIESFAGMTRCHLLPLGLVHIRVSKSSDKGNKTKSSPRSLRKKRRSGGLL